VAPATTSATLLLPANTVVQLQLDETVSSKTNKPGDFFKLHTLADVKIGALVVVPAGTPAVGQVVHAAKSGGGGKAGELILAARYLDTPSGQIKLHSGFWGSGRDKLAAANGMLVATAVIAPITGFLVFAIRGKEIELPVGSPLSARIAMDTPISSAP
jgi:hypothetical protein